MSFTTERFNEVWALISGHNRSGEEERFLDAIGQVLTMREVDLAIDYEAAGLFQASLSARRFNLKLGHGILAALYIHIRDVEIPDRGDRLDRWEGGNYTKASTLVWNILNEADTVLEWLADHRQLRRMLGDFRTLPTNAEVAALRESIADRKSAAAMPMA